jgi:hypothetical protein
VTIEARAARAARLRGLLDDQDVKDALAAVEADLVAAWQGCFDAAERDNLWRAQHALGLLRSKLGAWAQADISALKRGR